MNSAETSVEDVAREELVHRLRAIIERDSHGYALVSLFAARCALRVLPYLTASDPRLTYWIAKDNEDRRITHLLGVWWAIICGVSLNREFSDHASGAATDAASAADDDAVAYAYIAVFAADCAVYTYTAAFRDAAEATANAAADAVYAVIDAAEVHAVAAYASDFEYIENQKITISDYLSQPLWSANTSGNEYEVVLLRTWSEALYKLAADAEITDPQGARLVMEIAEAYPRIVNGSYALRDAEENVQELASYFKVTPKAQKTSQTSRRRSEQASSQTESNVPDALPADDAVQSTSIDEQRTTFNEAQIPEYSPIKNKASQHVLPETPSQEDHLNRGALTLALAAILAHKENDSHQTIGLLGDWGSGKSSFVKALQTQLVEQHSNQSFIFGGFNAWAYEHTPNLQAGMTQEVIKALVQAPARLKSLGGWKSMVQCWWWQLRLKGEVALALHGWWKMGTLFGRFMLAIFPLLPLVYFYKEIASAILPSNAGMISNDLHGALNFLQGYLAVGASATASVFLFMKLCVGEFKNIIATPQAKELQTYLKLPDYAKHLGEIPVMRKTLEKFCRVRLSEMLKKNDRSERLLFVIDDLDRCSPEGIVKVFEAVRLVLEIPQVSVLIAVDPKIALAALALHFEKVSKHHAFNNANAIARDYLAKVIHIPIVLAQPDPDGIQLFVEKLWERTLSESDKKFLESHSGEIQKQAMLSLDKTSAVSSEGIRLQVAPKLPTESSSIEKKEIDSPQLEMDATLNPDTKTKSKTLTEKDEVTKEVKPTLVASLSRTQKSAFVHWLKYFGLTNPRQVKRLNTTYNLMLTANENWDEKPIDVDVGVAMPNVDNAHYYPVLITLFVLEYLNGLDAQRTSLKKRLFNPSANTCVNTVVTEEFIQFFSQLRLQRDYLKLVEPFVLPAIELAETQV